MRCLLPVLLSIVSGFSVVGQEILLPMGPNFPNGNLNPFYNPSLIIGEHRLVAEMSNFLYEYTQMESIGFSFVNVSYEFSKWGTAVGFSYKNLTSDYSIQNTPRINIAQRFRIREHTLIPGMYFGFKSVRGVANMHSTDPNDNLNAMIFDVGMGISYRFRKLVMGISVGDWNSGEWEFGRKPYSRRGKVFIRPYLHGVVNYDFELGKRFRIMPVTALHWNPDFARLLFENHIVLGVDSLTRVLERINLGVGIRAGKSRDTEFKAFDFVISPEVVFRWFRMGYGIAIPIYDPYDVRTLTHHLTFRLNLFRVAGRSDSRAMKRTPIEEEVN